MRLYHRLDTDMAIECAFNGNRADAHLYNLSSGGCMVETESADASLGTPAVVKLEENTVLMGRVVWQNDHHAGIKFDDLLDHKVVERFGFRSNDPAFDVHDQVDRFGLPLEAPRRASAGSLDTL